VDSERVGHLSSRRFFASCIKSLTHAAAAANDDDERCRRPTVYIRRRHNWAPEFITIQLVARLASAREPNGRLAESALARGHERGRPACPIQFSRHVKNEIFRKQPAKQQECALVFAPPPPANAGKTTGRPRTLAHEKRRLILRARPRAEPHSRRHLSRPSSPSATIWAPLILKPARKCNPLVSQLKGAGAGQADILRLPSAGPRRRHAWPSHRGKRAAFASSAQEPGRTCKRAAPAELEIMSLTRLAARCTGHWRASGDRGQPERAQSRPDARSSNALDRISVQIQSASCP
jgi:hypothetical protein